MKKSVFITWNGNNELLAGKISVGLKNMGYNPIIGGHNHECDNTVFDTIHGQMNSCDYAIILLEKIGECKSDGAERIAVFNSNVLYEWGYVSHKFNTGRQRQYCDEKTISPVTSFFINCTDADVPSNFKGAWCQFVKREKYENESEMDKAFSKTASDILKIFSERYGKCDSESIDKLYYFSSWEKNKHDLIGGAIQDSQVEMILYSFQAVVYSDDIARLSDYLNRQTFISEDAKTAVYCIKAMLRIFTETNCLQNGLSHASFLDIKRDLLEVINKSDSALFEDDNLGAWCRIFAKDKLELAYIMVNREDKRVEYLKKAMTYNNEVYREIQEQIEKNKSDEMYARLYFSFVERNRAEIVKKLRELNERYTEDNSDTVYDEKYENEQRIGAYKNRDAVCRHYRREYGEDDIYDCLFQEYLLASAECCSIDDKYLNSDDFDREDIKDSIEYNYSKWEKRKKRHEMCWMRINAACGRGN